MKKGIDWYKEGFEEAVRLLESMYKDDSYESVSQMIDELKSR